MSEVERHPGVNTGKALQLHHSGHVGRQKPGIDLATPKSILHLLQFVSPVQSQTSRELEAQSALVVSALVVSTREQLVKDASCQDQERQNGAFGKAYSLTQQ